MHNPLMRVRLTLRARRVMIACALVAVLIAAIVFAVTWAGVDSAGSPPPSAPAAARPAACHVTRPNASTAPGEHPSNTFLGGRGLWTQLPLDGALRITTAVPPAAGETFGQIYRDGSLQTKFPWWGSGSAAQKLTIHGRRLDGPARGFRVTVGRGAIAHAPHFWPTRLRFSRPGCWQVRARSGRARLTFAVFVTRARH